MYHTPGRKHWASLLRLIQAGFGGQTGSHWKKFLDALVQYEADNDSGQDIIAGAEYAFNAISGHFAKNDQE